MYSKNKIRNILCSRERLFDDKYFQLGDWRRQGCLPMALDEQLHFFLHKPERLLIEESLKLKYPEILVKLHVARLGRETKLSIYFNGIFYLLTIVVRIIFLM